MIRAALLILLAGGLGSAMAHAQKVGMPAPEVRVTLVGDGNQSADRKEEELLINDLRGRIVVLFFWRHNDPASLEAAPKVYQLYQNFRAQGVALYMIQPNRQDNAEEQRREYDLARHGWGNAFSTIYQVVAYPYCFIVDPHGIVAWKGHPLDNLEQRLKDQIARTPPIGADAAALEDKLARALQMQAKGEIGRAYTLTRRVAGVTSEGDTMHDKAQGQLERLREAARKWLDECREAQRSGDPKKAAKIAADVSVRFANDRKDAPESSLVADADTEIGKLRGGMDTKEIVDRAVENARGEMRNDEAAELEITRDYALALRIYRGVFDDFPKTPAGEAARDAIERILADSRVMTKIRSDRVNSQADRWISIAERYQRVQMYAEARAQLEKVLKDFPRTPAATRAREMLKSLPKDDSTEKKG